MATGRHIEEVADIAAILLSEYRTGSPLHDALDLPDGSDGSDGSAAAGDTVLTIDIRAEGSELAGLLAVLGGVQTAFEAAVGAVFYDLERPDHTDENLDRYLLRSLIAEPRVTLEIVELYGGSFGSRLKAIAKSPVTHATIAAVAGIATVALSAAFPPLVIPALAITCVSGAGSVAGAVVVQRDQKRKDHGIEVRFEQLEQEYSEVSARLASVVESIEAKAAPVVGEVIDLPAAARAQPTEIVVELPERPAA